MIGAPHTTTRVNNGRASLTIQQLYSLGSEETVLCHYADRAQDHVPFWMYCCKWHQLWVVIDKYFCQCSGVFKDKKFALFYSSGCHSSRLIWSRDWLPWSILVTGTYFLFCIIYWLVEQIFHSWPPSMFNPSGYKLSLGMWLKFNNLLEFVGIKRLSTGALIKISSFLCAH